MNEYCSSYSRRITQNRWMNSSSLQPQLRPPSERQLNAHPEVDRITEEEPSVSALRNSRPPKGTQNKQSGLPRRQQQRAPRKQHTGKCASCGGDHVRKTCRFISAKCHNCGKIGHIARVCGAKRVVITEQQPSESAVVTISQKCKQLQIDISPMFQILHLPHMQKRLRLMVDSASPITLITSGHVIPK